MKTSESQCGSACQRGSVHRVSSQGTAATISSVITASAARNAVMIRLTYLCPPSESFLIARTICGTSTVFRAPPAKSM